ncbi:hypothetical protein PPL_01215 [Heterostelium album PN500]|uniref:Sugar phosphate transporter domain-containing protein n=1 Tax=Heterostelium pallidum (strain ATCC 26659 / Pp 5 / PN500) TaxID=670386 RepID=D3AYF5_HETP5|nr:hypothetical protein PPL_01215 [Heterostelium album PN500]EFA85982.1 hypothetical protein PPL_01215 [Heterostelium album PN500]|eukprot:XP_020438088.1 hypothetical protein PPL_01215 [Heterostelium album PN500]
MHEICHWIKNSVRNISNSNLAIISLATWFILNISTLILNKYIYGWDGYGTVRPLLILIASGIIAFLLNVFTFLVIKYTSPLTYTVSGNLKVVLSITISILIFKNEVNFLNAIGCGIAIIGVIWYSQIRYEASRPKS